jgi:hypothetical protein
MHTMLGTPLIRKVVMATAGKERTAIGGNYRLDPTKSKIEAATDFAYRDSVYNEVVHTVGSLPSAAMVTIDALTNNFGVIAEVNVGAVALNAALVALQRYSRAKMIKRIEEELHDGATFSSGYENKFGIDHRAVQNYEATLPASVLDFDNTHVDVAPPGAQTYLAYPKY